MGAHGAISALLGGLINIVAGAVFGWLLLTLDRLPSNEMAVSQGLIATMLGVRREGVAESRWVLLDFVDVVVHVQHTEEREFYALERLWRDCPALTLPADVTSGRG